jgi:ribosome modulation factor
MEQRTEGMKKQAQELIEQAYKRGYTAGYSKAENDYHAKTEDDRKSSYELGLNMAWETAKKIYSTIKNGALHTDEIRKIFDVRYLTDVLEEFSASEAIEKIKAYEEQKKQQEEECIKVGDEVIYHDDKGVVVLVANNGKAISVMSANGGWMIRADSENLVKTGRTFPEIAEVLKKLQEGE